MRVLVGVLLVAGVVVGTVRLTAEEAPTKLRIIYSNDMRGEWKPCG